MELFIVRHGEAVGEAPGLGDEGRFLTEKGRRVTRRVARFLAKKPGRRPAEIWTSPLVRAVQTAEILAEVSGVRAGVVAKAELAPGRDPGDLLALLAAHAPSGPIALVGHEPSLSVLASSLLGKGFAGLRKSAVLALKWDGKEPAELRFLLDPKTLERHEHLDDVRRSDGSK
ncbi:MAG TPA: phosphohistidine phosphatase SixA [Byssovorax sp.]|jgi:phosphohistidine phosphatase